MSTAELLGSFQRPVLNQDPTQAAIPGGATLTLLQANVIGDGGLITAVVVSDVAVVVSLKVGAVTVTETGTKVVLQQLGTLGQAVTVTAKANSGPVFRIQGSATYTDDPLAFYVPQLGNGGVTTLAGGTIPTAGLSVAFTSLLSAGTYLVTAAVTLEYDGSASTPVKATQQVNSGTATEVGGFDSAWCTIASGLGPTSLTTCAIWTVPNPASPAVIALHVITNGSSTVNFDGTGLTGITWAKLA